MVEPVAGPVGVPPPPQATTAATTASKTNLRTGLTSRSTSADVNRILIRPLGTGHFLDRLPEHRAWIPGSGHRRRDHHGNAERGRHKEEDAVLVGLGECRADTGPDRTARERAGHEKGGRGAADLGRDL